MIRDPSDGTVKPPLSAEAIEVLKREARKPPGPALDHEPTRKFMAGEYSGLPFSSTKPENVKRLEKSRRQLENFRKTGVWDDRSTDADG